MKSRIFRFTPSLQDNAVVFWGVATVYDCSRLIARGYVKT